MYYEHLNYGGMHLFWWVLWMIFLIWIFATPYHIPGQRFKRETPLDILKRRFALGEINKEAYLEGKKILEQHSYLIR